MSGTVRLQAVGEVFVYLLVLAWVTTALSQVAAGNTVATNMPPGELAQTGWGSLEEVIDQLIVAWFIIGLSIAGLIFVINRYTSIIDQFGKGDKLTNLNYSQSGQQWNIDSRSPNQHQQQVPGDSSGSVSDSNPKSATTTPGHDSDTKPGAVGGTTAPVVTESLKKGNKLRDEANNYRSVEQYDRAITTYREAQETYKDALETVSEREIDGTEEIKQKLAAVQAEKREVFRQKLQQEVESIRSNLDHAETLADKGELEKAKERLADLEPRLAKAIESATKQDFDEIHDEVSRIEQKCEKTLKKVADRLKARRIPDKIPRAHTTSVDYDALTEVEPIGGGGNADVTKAKLSTPDGEVVLAIKEPRMSGTLSKNQMERMLEEAETWDKLDSHDHIVGVVDYDSDPMPWIAMEYMDGGHLGERSGEMDTTQALWTAISVTKGVRHAHRRGVAHLDLKPENILFRTVEDAWDVPKVGDWGLSKHLLEHSKSIEGYTPTYSSPEQLDDGYGQADDITDVYQLGAVFYELFTGRPPFEGDSTGQIIRQVITKKPTPPSEVADVPESMNDILLTALAKDKADRYDDIILLRNALQEIL